jgi:branched-chain amino acid transport system substrate-binding protein
MKRLCSVAILVLTLTSSAALAQEPIKIGFLYVMSGRVAQFGHIAKQGADLAISEINRSGGINGRQVKGIFRDTKARPDIAITEAENLVKKDNVQALIGVISSGVASALTPKMNELKIPLIITTALTPVVTGSKCNRYTFRITYNLHASVKAAALLASRLKVKRWSTVGPDYSLGHVSWDLFQKYLHELRPEVSFEPKTQVVFASLKTTDWAPFVEKLKRSDATGFLISLWGGNFVDFVKEGNKQGFFSKSKDFVASVVSLGTFFGLGLQMPPGIWLTPPYFFEANSDKINKSFVEAYTKRYRGPPPYQAQFAFSGVKAYAEAVRLAGSTNPDAVVKALEGLTLELPVGKVTIRPGDHQAVFAGLAGKTSSKYGIARRSPFRRLESIIRFPGEEMFLPVKETGCEMR